MQYYNPDNNSSRRWAWLAAGLYGALLAAAFLFVSVDASLPVRQADAILVEFEEPKVPDPPVPSRPGRRRTGAYADRRRGVVRSGQRFRRGDADGQSQGTLQDGQGRPRRARRYGQSQSAGGEGEHGFRNRFGARCGEREPRQGARRARAGGGRSPNPTTRPT